MAKQLLPDPPSAPAVDAGTATSPPTGQPSDLRQLARGGALTLAGVVAGGVLGFVLVVLITRSYGARFTGVFFACVALFTILSTIGELGASTGVLRTLPRLRVERRDGDLGPVLLVALRPVVVLATAMAVSVWLLAPQLGAVVSNDHPEEAARYLRLLAPFLLVAACTTVVLSAFRALGSVKPYVLLENLVKPGARPLGVLVAVALGLGGAAVTLAWAAPVAVGAVVAAVLLVRLVRRLAGPQSLSAGTRAQRVALSREFWAFAAPRAVAASCAIVVVWSAVVFLGALRSAEEAGIYTAVSRLVLAGYFAIHGLRLVLGPMISRLLAEGRHDGVQHLYSVATGWLMLLSWPFYLSVAVFPSAYLSLFGADFETVGAVALVVLAVTSLIDMGTGNITLVLLMAGHSRLNLANTVAALAVNLTLSVLLIPTYGVTGAALAWGAAILVENLAALWQVNRRVGVRPFGRSYVTAAAVAVACFGLTGLVVRSVVGDGAAGLAWALVLGAVPYLLVTARLRRLLELEELLQLVAGRFGGRRGRHRGTPAQAGR